jgi:hypothetical protein
MTPEKTRDADDNRALKKRLVDEGRAHAALVMDGDEAVGWCQYGLPAELPDINHRKECEATRDQLPDCRITCFCIDKRPAHGSLGRCPARRPGPGRPRGWRGRRGGPRARTTAC